MGIQLRAKKIIEELNRLGHTQKDGKSMEDLINLQVLRLTGDEYMGKGYKFMLVGNELTFPFV